MAGYGSGKSLRTKGLRAADLSQAGLPVLFIVHSLGGLVCENVNAISVESPREMLTLQALTVANNAEQHEKRVLEYTRAIAFLGTPHRGSELASWAIIAANMVKVVKRANTDILKVLEPSSEVLEILTQDFHTMLRSREQAQNSSIEITCFVEELPVSKNGKTFMVCREIFCGWCILVDCCQVVPSKSATLERYAYKTMHADHINMTKFKDKNDDYKKLMLQLKRWMEKLAVTEVTPDETPEYGSPLV